MRISSQSNPGNIAGAIAGLLRMGQTATLETIGAGATYKAIKAIDIASVFLKEDGIVPAISLESTKRSIKGVDRYTLLILVKGERNGE